MHMLFLRLRKVFQYILRIGNCLYIWCKNLLKHVLNLGINDFWNKNTINKKKVQYSLDLVETDSNLECTKHFNTQVPRSDIIISRCGCSSLSET